MWDMFFGKSIIGVLLISVVADMAYIGLIVGFFLLGLAYLSGCLRLRKGGVEK